MVQGQEIDELGRVLAVERLDLGGHLRGDLLDHGRVVPDRLEHHLEADGLGRVLEMAHAGHGSRTALVAEALLREVRGGAHEGVVVLREQRLKFALDDASGSYDVCLIDCSPVMRRLAFNAYLAATEGGMVVIPVKLDSTVMRGTALTVEATRSIADALRMPTPRWKILRTCVPGRMTNAEATGAAVLDGFFPGEQFETVIHASSKVCEGSWQWKPVAAFEPGSRPARDYEALADEVSRELA